MIGSGGDESRRRFRQRRFVRSGLAVRRIFDLGPSNPSWDPRAVADLGTSLSARKKIVDDLGEFARSQRMQTGESCKNHGTHELRYGQGRIEVTELPLRLRAIEQIFEGLSISIGNLSPQRRHGVVFSADRIVSVDSGRVIGVQLSWAETHPTENSELYRCCVDQLSRPTHYVDEPRAKIASRRRRHHRRQEMLEGCGEKVCAASELPVQRRTRNPRQRCHCIYSHRPDPTRRKQRRCRVDESGA